MYDVLHDLERLSFYDDFMVRKFICITDNPYYVKTAHSGNPGSVSIRDGTLRKKGSKIIPTWIGAGWKDTSRDRELAVRHDISIEWSENRGWYSLSITV